MDLVGITLQVKNLCKHHLNWQYCPTYCGCSSVYLKIVNKHKLICFGLNILHKPKFVCSELCRVLNYGEVDYLKSGAHKRFSLCSGCRAEDWKYVFTRARLRGIVSAFLLVLGCHKKKYILENQVYIGKHVLSWKIKLSLEKSTRLWKKCIVLILVALVPKFKFQDNSFTNYWGLG